MSVILVFLLGLCLASGRNVPFNVDIQQKIDAFLAQNYGEEKNIINPRNMVTVPTNCPDGQQLVNGVCRDIWRNAAVTPSSIPRNMVTVPTNCPDGQQLVNGVCRDIWRNVAVTQRSVISPQNVVTVPTNCPEGQELVNGVCRDIWRNFAVTQSSIPRNMVTVPTNCPVGQQLVSGVCRDIWRSAAIRDKQYLENILKALTQGTYYSRNVRQADGGEISISADDILRMNVDRNIISVPNQCPDGYRPDSFGICREILP
ncbi:uncharacterized protein LOC121731129 isoform X3 [Aricia agestis]|uniref:uncharacterized protein LOC121731129 isoform X3 n=1 Tax=Aricia agestis TaxID=91739 RepID=UPI001C2098C8|nr:uncharacterized protein LOC121731129 isoform X3 [Aricia agestis]